ncbi:MAG TPA: hypothetical protein VEK07_18840 [Polyangiaceae bacterium]|nr:hypothetical protein [Polyangiaceae bacterium]
MTRRARAAAVVAASLGSLAAASCPAFSAYGQRVASRETTHLGANGDDREILAQTVTWIASWSARRASFRVSASAAPRRGCPQPHRVRAFGVRSDAARDQSDDKPRAPRAHQEGAMT